MSDPKREVRLAVMRAGREAHLPTQQVIALEQALVENNFRQGAARRMLSSHIPARCPGCGVEGFYRWQALGRFTHPECGRRWVASPYQYLLLKAGWGVSGGLKMGFDVPTALQEGVGFSLGTGCLIGLARVLFGFVLLPLQTLVWILSDRG